MRRIWRIVFALTVLDEVSCSSPAAPTTESSSVPSGSAPSGVLVGAGDIGYCGSPGVEATARLLDGIEGTVFTTGDHAYMNGTAEEFQRCYDPSWGRHRSRTRPAPGNHDYGSRGGPYFDYFGANAGPAGAGYYGYTVGPWYVIALNSEVPFGPGTPQMEWLRNELSTHRTFCSAAYWHRPLFSSGRHGDNLDMRDVWRTLYEFDVDVVINGHDHTYERFAAQDPIGLSNAARGIREFVVGTGGAPLYEFPLVRPNSEVRIAAWGVAVFTLSEGGYQWEFVPADGIGPRDSGAGTCH
jgi:Calcineurin-like phosphoesterase